MTRVVDLPRGVTMFQHSRVQRTDSVYIVIVSNLIPPLDLCRNDLHSEEAEAIVSSQKSAAIRGGVVLDAFLSSVTSILTAEKVGDGRFEDISTDSSGSYRIVLVLNIELSLGESTGLYGARAQRTSAANQTPGFDSNNNK